MNKAAYAIVFSGSILVAMKRRELILNARRDWYDEKVAETSSALSKEGAPVAKKTR